jgi:heparanase
MGTKVLNPGVESSEKLHIYAHCLQNSKGGVALLAINTDQSASHRLDLATKSSSYTLTAKTLDATAVDLNGSELKLNSNDLLPKLNGKPTHKGEVAIAPASISFFAVPSANNASCK